MVRPTLQRFHHTDQKQRVTSLIKYKLSLINHKAIHHKSPEYIASLGKLSDTSIHFQKKTRSSNLFLLETPHINNVPS